MVPYLPSVRLIAICRGVKFTVLYAVTHPLRE